MTEPQHTYTPKHMIQRQPAIGQKTRRFAYLWVAVMVVVLVLLLTACGDDTASVCDSVDESSVVGITDGFWEEASPPKNPLYCRYR